MTIGSSGKCSVSWLVSLTKERVAKELGIDSHTLDCVSVTLDRHILFPWQSVFDQIMEEVQEKKDEQNGYNRSMERTKYEVEIDFVRNVEAGKRKERTLWELLASKEAAEFQPVMIEFDIEHCVSLDGKNPVLKGDFEAPIILGNWIGWDRGVKMLPAETGLISCFEEKVAKEHLTKEKASLIIQSRWRGFITRKQISAHVLKFGAKGVNGLCKIGVDSLKLDKTPIVAAESTNTKTSKELDAEAFNSHHLAKKSCAGKWRLFVKLPATAKLFFTFLYAGAELLSTHYEIADNPPCNAQKTRANYFQVATPDPMLDKYLLNLAPQGFQIPTLPKLLRSRKKIELKSDGEYFNEILFPQYPSSFFATQSEIDLQNLNLEEFFQKENANEVRDVIKNHYEFFFCLGVFLCCLGMFFVLLFKLLR